jgi:rod shape-determining protein MreB
MRIRLPFFDRLAGNISQDIGIDLGTAYSLVYVRGRGVVINEPSVVAINKKTKQVLAIGEEAKKMVGRTPSHIVAIRPLVDGVISDFEVTEAMLKYFIEKVHKTRFSLVPRPRVVIGIPYGVTEVERRAVEEAALSAGARQVFLIEEPMAAAIGANLPVQEATGCMVVDIGGGTTEVAVISLGGIVTSRSLRVAGDELNDDIIAFARDEYNLLLGERTAEDIKITIGSAAPTGEKLTYPMRGRDLITGLPKEIIVSEDDIRKAFTKSVTAIVDAVKLTVEETPPELLADIMDRGIILAGGGALLRGLDRLLAESTHMPVYIATDPLSCVARGTGLVLENLDHLQEVLLPTIYR